MSIQVRQLLIMSRGSKCTKTKHKHKTKQAEVRYQQMIEGVRQQAFTALNQQTQIHIQQQAQYQAQAAAVIQQIEHKAQSFAYEAQGAMQRERQERERMTAEEQTAKQAEKTIQQREQQREQQIKQIIEEEEHRRRNYEREAPVTPRAKAKAKSGPSPKKKSEPSPKILPKTPPFPDGGEKPSGSTSNPESAHEPKGRRGRPSNTQPTNQGPTKVRKDMFKETPTPKTKAKTTPKAKTRANPNHDTDRTDNPDPEFGKEQIITVLKDQLNKRGFQKHKKRWD